MLVTPALRLFLPARARAGMVDVDVAADPTASLGHAVQAAGVPLTEVGELRLAGMPAPPGRRLAAGDEVEVLARPRPQPLEGPPRLLLDVHLGALARRLRLLGVDAAYANDADDPALVAQAGAEDRLLLTQDRGLLRRRALRRAAYVRGARPDEQLADVLDRFGLPLEPYTRCTVCNGALAPVAKGDVLDRLEPGTRRTQEEFSRCSECARVYWRGAHAARLDARVREHVRLRAE
nr:Mut7-C ubiquitin/RNAse domain-containing protein [Motilibacter aurantiacus]